jgi:hypothetical protein
MIEERAMSWPRRLLRRPAVYIAALLLASLVDPTWDSTADPESLGPAGIAAAQIAPTKTPTRPPGRGSLAAPATPTPTRQSVVAQPTATPTNTPPTIVNPRTPTPTTTPVGVTGPGPGPNLPDQVAGEVTVGDIRPVQIQLMQSISSAASDGQNFVPLIAEKESLLRVWVLVDGYNPGPLGPGVEPKQVRVSLTADSNHEHVGGCGTATADVTKTIPSWQTEGYDEVNWKLKMLEDLTMTFNFQLPPDCSWLAEGDLSVTATVHGPECTECLGNNTYIRGWQLHNVRPLKVKYQPITYGISDLSYQEEHFDILKSMYPITAVSVFEAPPVEAPYDIDLVTDPGSDEWWEEYADLRDWLIDCCWSDAEDIDAHLGVIDANTVQCKGIGAYGRSAIAGVGCGGTYAHEIGHVFYLPHSSNEHDECEGGACDEDWPWAHGGFAGLGWTALQPNKLIGYLMDSSHSHDLMSYGDCPDGAPTYDGPFDPEPVYCDKWLSTLNYARIAQRLRCTFQQWNMDDPQWDCYKNQAPFAEMANEEFASAPPSIAPSAHAHHHGNPATQHWPPGDGPVFHSMALRGERLQGGAGYLKVAGRILPDGTVELRPFYRASATARLAAHSQGRGSHRLELVGEDGAVLVGRSFDPIPLAAHAPISRFWIGEELPWHPAARKILLRRGGTVLAERAVSPSSPSVTLLTPNGGERLPPGGDLTITWQASDPDGDALSYWLEYSVDGGQKWQTIYRNLTKTSYTLPLKTLHGNPRVSIRIHATDGVNTTTDVSDAPFEVTGSPSTRR